MPFTEVQLQRLKPKPARFVLTETGVSADRRGLQLRVSPQGRKTFVYRYSFEGSAALAHPGRLPRAIPFRGSQEAAGVPGPFKDRG